MKHNNLSAIDSLIAVNDFLIALGYNTKTLTVDQAFTLKRNIFEAIENSDLEVELES